MNKFVEELIETMPTGFLKSVAQIMGTHVGYSNRCPKHLLLEKVSALYPNRKPSHLDRRVRLAISKLQERGIPIVSQSNDGGGYWIAEHEDEIRGAVNETKSRIRHLESKLIAWDKALAIYG